MVIDAGATPLQLLAPRAPAHCAVPAGAEGKPVGARQRRRAQQLKKQALLDTLQRGDVEEEASGEGEVAAMLTNMGGEAQQGRLQLRAPKNGTRALRLGAAAELRHMASITALPVWAANPLGSLAAHTSAAFGALPAVPAAAPVPEEGAPPPPAPVQNMSAAPYVSRRTALGIAAPRRRRASGQQGAGSGKGRVRRSHGGSSRQARRDAAARESARRK